VQDEIMKKLSLFDIIEMVLVALIVWAVIYGAK